MTSQSYLMVSLNGLQYAIETRSVLEIFLLPALEPVIEAPRDIVGVLNLRTQLLPVMHLGVRLGVTADTCTLHDSVVVVGNGKHRIGMVVHAVHEVQNIESSCIESEIPYGRAELAKPRWLAGVAKRPDSIVMLLNVQQIIESAAIPPPSVQDVQSVQAMAFALDADGLASKPWDLSAIAPSLAQPAVALQEQSPVLGFYDRWCPQATVAERAIFQERADHLRQPLVDDADTQLIPLAIVRLNSEYFGFDLDRVREFAPIQTVTAIPCCPPYIVGDMNLRGEIVTLIDIRQALNLSAPAQKAQKVMVVTVNDIVAGVPVDEVVDVLYLSPTEMMEAPIAVRSQQQEYVRGTAQYRDHLFSVVDVFRLMTSGALTVNEMN